MKGKKVTRDVKTQRLFKLLHGIHVNFFLDSEVLNSQVSEIKKMNVTGNFDI